MTILHTDRNRYHCLYHTGRHSQKIIPLQVKELVDIVKESQADFVILGGDFNSDPVVNKNETTLTDITDIMVSSISEIFLKLEVK